MPSRPLGKCPTCYRQLDDATRAAMGLRNGEVLNALCPGRNGPSDIDNVLHNKYHPEGERVMFLEYKSNGASLSGGQRILLDALWGDWQDRNTGGLLSIRRRVLDLHPPDPEAELQPIVDWLWG